MAALPLRRAGWLLAVLAGVTIGSRTAAAQEWHELYADGQKALAAGRLDRAADFFQRAIQKRPQPGTNVPTYGTNFEPRYFPYLRLAEVFVKQEAFDEALKTLETSARFGVEPANERLALQTQARTALDLRRPPSRPVQAPSPSPVPVTPADPPAQLPASPAAADTPATRPATAAVDSTRIRPAERPTTATPPAPPPSRREPPVLEITSDPPGAAVFIDNTPAGRTDTVTGRLRLTALAAGRHRVRLSAEGRVDLVRDVDLGNGTLALEGALASAAAPVAPAGSTVAPPEPPRRTNWLLGGLGLVAVLLLAVLLRRPMRYPTNPEPDPTAQGSGSFEKLPAQFGDYTLLRRIGKGGMAAVYEAERRGERFALKRPLTGFLDDSRFRERFLREADLGRTLHHPNIIRIFDRGEAAGIPYFVMELIDGETLKDRLDRDGRLEPAVATRIIAQVTEALDYAHHKGVVHRDLKPTNIMLERTGGVKVMDYGIARAQFNPGVTTTGGFLGTPHYAAPEALDAHSEPRSDIYSVGVVFFEMLTGALPFKGDNALAVLSAKSTTDPPGPASINYAVSPELDRIVLRAMAREPGDRPTAEELRNQLSDCLERNR
ncbi:MAG: protein kinase [Gemmatimonadales bacterium]